MSILQAPRINFHGTIEWDPNTFNNSPNYYSVETSDPLGAEYKKIRAAWEKATDNGQLPDFAQSYDQYLDWTTTYQAQLGAMPGDWNPLGGHGVSCEQVSVQTTVLDNAKGASDDNDPIVGKPFTINGNTFTEKDNPPARLVDVNAYGSSSSQIYFDWLQLGDSIGLKGKRSTRMYSRWIWFGRNTSGLAIAGNAGVIFQTGILADDIDWQADYAQSPALKQLKAAVDAGKDSHGRPVKGLLMQCAAYTTLYFSKQPDGPAYQNSDIPAAQQTLASRIAQDLANDKITTNPAVSSLTGSIGLWHQDELSVSPTDRYLMPQNGNIGPATAARTEGSNQVMLNLINAIQETGPNNKKIEMNQLVLQLQKAGQSQWTDLGSIQRQASDNNPYAYGRSAYQSQGGIVGFSPDDSISPDDIDQGQLRLISRSQCAITGKPANLTQSLETDLRAETDQHGIYIDQGESVTLTINVYNQGQLAKGQQKLHILLTQFPASQTHDRIVADAQGKAINAATPPPISDVHPHPGTANLPPTPAGEGATYLNFSPYSGDSAPPEPPQFQAVTASYCVVRGMPQDNALEQSISDAELNFDKLYQTVLYSWDLTYPIMSKIRPLHNQRIFDGMAQQVTFAIDPAQFESCYYMPITRDLSAGKRKLIQRYINKLP